MTMLRFVSRRYPPVPPAGAGGAALSLLIVYTTITTNNFATVPDIIESPKLLSKFIAPEVSEYMPPWKKLMHEFGKH